MSYVKLSLNKLLVCNFKQKEVLLLLMKRMNNKDIFIKFFSYFNNVGLQKDNQLYIQYIQKLSKLLKYIGDLFQVLSTNTNIGGKTPVLYTFDSVLLLVYY